MSGPDDRTRRIQDYLDGYLTPNQEAGVRRRIETDDAWRREHAALRTVYSLLDTPLDDDPPADLLPGIFDALEADALRRAEARRLPARVERGLVLAGATGLAALLVTLARFLTPQDVYGRLALGGASALSVATDWIVRSVGAFVHLDWARRMITTLADAGQTVLGAASEPLLGVGLVSIAFTLGLGWWVLRSGARVNQGGLSHG